MSDQFEKLKSQVLVNGNIPEHIAIIMDGNGRWAKKRNMPRIKGHHAGVETVRQVLETCQELGVKVLTLYAFSEENWKRPPNEVSALMTLLSRTVQNEINELDKNNVCLMLIGRTQMLESNAYKGLMKGAKQTENNTGIKLVLALSYGSRSEIIDGVRGVVKDIKDNKISLENIDEEMFNRYLYTHELPDPDLLIRTSGEMRISNFLLWQIAYTELWITETYWPDFTKNNLCEAIISYQKRERRFGLQGDQINK